MVRPTPDVWPPGTWHRWESDATAPAAIRADERLPPGVDVDGTHPVGHDHGPSRLGTVPPAHVTEFRRNGVTRQTRPRVHEIRGVSGRPPSQHWGTPPGPAGLSLRLGMHALGVAPPLTCRLTVRRAVTDAPLTGHPWASIGSPTVVSIARRPRWRAAAVVVAHARVHSIAAGLLFDRHATRTAHHHLARAASIDGSADRAIASRAG
jgi:hypothetical protein